MSGPSTAAIDRLQRLQPALWVVVIACFGAGDMVTTAAGLRLAGVVEAGPVAGSILDRYGIAGMFGLKLLTVAGGYALWRVVPAPHRVGVPLGLALVGVAVTAWNLAVVSIALW